MCIRSACRSPDFIECPKRFGCFCSWCERWNFACASSRKSQWNQTCGGNVFSWNRNVWPQRRSGSSFYRQRLDRSRLQGINAYIRAKTLAEKAAWDFVNNECPDMTLAVVNPGLILGPLLDPKDAGVSCEGIKQMFTGELPMFPRLGFSVVDVRDVAQCQLLAMQKEEAGGHRFLCGGEFAWFSDLGAMLREQYPDRYHPR